VLRSDPVEYLNTDIVQGQLSNREKDALPSNDDLLRVDLVVELVHRSVIFHIDSNLLARLAMENSKGRSHFDFVPTANTEKGSNNTFLGLISSKIVVKDGEQGDRVDGDTGWGPSKWHQKRDIVFIVEI
jgi:hypothetical protein